MAVSKQESRKRKKQRQHRRRGAGLGVPRGSSPPDGPVVLQLLECEITCEPIPDPLIEAMPPVDRKKFRELERMLQEQRYDMVEELEQFRDRHPQVPKIYNYLMVAYQAAGRFQDAERLIEETYQRFPNYLFGLTNYVRLCLMEGRVDEATTLLGGKLHIRLMYPHRRCFHVSEFSAYTGTVAEYLFWTGKVDVALTHLRMLEEINPDHPITRHVQRLLRGGAIFKSPAGVIRRPRARSFRR